MLLIYCYCYSYCLQRARVLQLEGSVKSKEAELARTNKLLDATKASEYDFASKHLAAEDVARQLETDVTNLKQQLVVVQGTVKSKEGEIARLNKQLEASKVSNAGTPPSCTHAYGNAQMQHTWIPYTLACLTCLYAEVEADYATNTNTINTTRPFCRILPSLCLCVTCVTGLGV